MLSRGNGVTHARMYVYVYMYVCIHMCVCTPAAQQLSPLKIPVAAPLKMVEIIPGLGQLHCRWDALKFYGSPLVIAGLKKMLV